MRIEIVLIILSICSMVAYLYKLKEVHVLRFKKLVKVKRSRRYIRIRNEKDSRLLSELKFMTAVMMNKELEFYANRIWKLTAMVAVFNVIILIFILTGDANILQRSFIIVLANIFVYRLIFGFCLVKHKRDAHRYVTVLQNETLKKSDIISCATDVSAKSPPSLTANEIMISLTSHTLYPA